MQATWSPSRRRPQPQSKPANRKPRPCPVQDEILEFLRDYKRDPNNDGNSPTYDEIAEALDRWPGTVHRYCQSMERRGVIRFNQRGKIVLPGGRYLAPGDEVSETSAKKGL